MQAVTFHGATSEVFQVKNEIDGLLSPSNEATELAALLNNVHLQVGKGSKDFCLTTSYI